MLIMVSQLLQTDFWKLQNSHPKKKIKNSAIILYEFIGWDSSHAVLRQHLRLDKTIIGIYNVITMITTLIAIGNSRGVRIPKPLIAESGLEDKVELQVKKGEIRIIAAPMKDTSVTDTLLLSEKILGADWNRTEEDKAWASLQ